MNSKAINNFLLKNVSPYQILSIINKASSNKEKLLKQLEQLGMDMQQYQHLSLKQLIIKAQTILKTTYSIKYLGLNKNEMGIISRRINPLSDKDFKIYDNAKQMYSIHQYFYPKPLKTGKKVKNHEQINLQNLQHSIKKQFQQNKSSHIQKMKENHNQRLKSRIGGSWRTLPKTKMNCTDYYKNLNMSKQIKINEMGKTIKQNVSKANSISRFLKEGILIIRD